MGHVDDPISPKTMASPTDMIKRIELRLTARKNVSIAVDQAAQVSMRSIEARAALAKDCCDSLALRSSSGEHDLPQSWNGILTRQIAKGVHRNELGGLVITTQLEQGGGLLHRIAHPFVGLLGRGLFEPGNGHRPSQCPEIRRGRAACVRLRTFEFGTVPEQVHHRFDGQSDRPVGIGADVLEAGKDRAVALFDHDAQRRLTDSLVFARDLGKGLVKRRERGRWRRACGSPLTGNNAYDACQHQQAKKQSLHNRGSS